VTTRCNDENQLDIKENCVNDKRLASYVATLALSTALYTATVAGSDVLYIGDGADNTVKGFDADTGDYLGAFVKKGTVP